MMRAQRHEGDVRQCWQSERHAREPLTVRALLAPHLSRDGRVVARNKGVVNSRVVNFGSFSMSRGTLGWVAPGLPSFTWLEIDR
jgi:hypothetical protein